MTDGPDHLSANPDDSEEHPGDFPGNTAGDRPIGYKNPPKHTRFKPGQPRPKRKPPKDEESWFELFRLELNKRIWVEENCKRMRITKRHAWMKRVVNGAVKGDANSMKTLLKIEKFDQPGEEGLRFIIEE